MECVDNTNMPLELGDLHVQRTIANHQPTIDQQVARPTGMGGSYCSFHLQAYRRRQQLYLVHKSRPCNPLAWSGPTAGNASTAVRSNRSALLHSLSFRSMERIFVSSRAPFLASTRWATASVRALPLPNNHLMEYVLKLSCNMDANISRQKAPIGNAAELRQCQWRRHRSPSKGRL